MRFVCLSVCLMLAAMALTPAEAARPASVVVRKPVAAGYRGPHPGVVGGPAKRPGSVGGVTPHR
jgi:hypothetical protein